MTASEVRREDRKKLKEAIAATLRDPEQTDKLLRDLKAAQQEAEAREDAEDKRLDEYCAAGGWRDGDVVAFLAGVIDRLDLPAGGMTADFLRWWLASRSAAFQIANDAGMIPESHQQYGATRLRSGSADSPELKSAMECLSGAAH